ncbi:hypothetical protein ILYODFUR_027016 [Ilyodon furcidens]|uniref:Uncharacterized protein n=1 Tax=Ilyodon furcidens TaxID=33524 RepID=A0ABV0UMA1_9TELE
MDAEESQLRSHSLKVQNRGHLMPIIFQQLLVMKGKASKPKEVQMFLCHPRKQAGQNQGPIREFSVVFSLIKAGVVWTVPGSGSLYSWPQSSVVSELTGLLIFPETFRYQQLCTI